MKWKQNKNQHLHPSFETIDRQATSQLTIYLNKTENNLII